jgi:hypothetical protein
VGGAVAEDGFEFFGLVAGESVAHVQRGRQPGGTVLEHLIEVFAA